MLSYKLVGEMKTWKMCNEIIMTLTYFPPQVARDDKNIQSKCYGVCVCNRNLLLSFRSSSVDLEPLPSPADSSAPANHRGSSELGSHSE